MKKLQIVPPNTKIDFVGRRKGAFIFSGALELIFSGFLEVKAIAGWVA